jgi:hypothetical protein
MRLKSAALILVASLTSGCAYFAGEIARYETEVHELDAYVIPSPLEDVWAAAPSVSGKYSQLTISLQGFTWEETGPFKMKTKGNATASGGHDKDVTTTWYRAEGQRVGDGCRVRYFEVKEHMTFNHGVPSTSTEEKRRPDLELELIKKFDPNGAGKIETDGENAAQKAAEES